MRGRLTRVEIHNYRQYEDIVVEFAQDKNIIAFEAKNGAGKSNFLNAIAWCLYGDEPFKGKDKSDYLLSTHLKLDETHKNDTVSVQVDAILGTTPVRFLRTRVEGSEIGGIQMRFTAFYLRGDDWVDYPNPLYFVDNFLPKSLREFFMFDGENVKSMFEPGYDVHIKKNTEVISYIDLISRTSGHLSKILIDTRRQLGKEAPDLSGLIDEQNVLTEKLVKTEAYFNEDTALLKQLQEERDTYRDKQKTIDDHKHLTSRQETLLRSQEAAKKHLEHYNSDYHSQIGTVAPLAFLHNDFNKFAAELESLEKSGDLPPKVNPEYVRDLIEGKLTHCVCGHEVDHDAKQHLAEMLDSLDRAQSKSYLLSSNVTLSSVNHKLKSVVSELRNLKTKITDTEKELSANELELQDLKRKIGDAGGAIGDLQTTINGLEHKINEVNQRLWSEEQEIKQDRDRLFDLKRKIDLQGDIKSKHEALAKKIETIEFCISKLNQLGELNLHRSRASLSEAMKNYFKELFWKKEYRDISIDKNFEIVILKDVNGQTTQMPVSQLSGGEGATLGYSLMKGLSELSGFKNTPVFIDGPISDYDEHMQQEILDSLINFVPHKQLFVFFKEDSNLVQPFISKNLDKIDAYKIDRDESAATSTVERWTP